jgi:hypothetical protein
MHMTDDTEAAANRAAIAARDAVKARSRSGASFIPLLAVAFAILSGIYLFLMEGENPPRATTPMPVPHVQAPGEGSAPAPTTPAPQQ